MKTIYVCNNCIDGLKCEAIFVPEGVGYHLCPYDPKVRANWRISDWLIEKEDMPCSLKH